MVPLSVVGVAHNVVCRVHVWEEGVAGGISRQGGPALYNSQMEQESISCKQ